MAGFVDFAVVVDAAVVVVVDAAAVVDADVVGAFGMAVDIGRLTV